MKCPGGSRHQTVTSARQDSRGDMLSDSMLTQLHTGSRRTLASCCADAARNFFVMFAHLLNFWISPNSNRIVKGRVLIQERFHGEESYMIGPDELRSVAERIAAQIRTSESVDQMLKVMMLSKGPSGRTNDGALNDVTPGTPDVGHGKPPEPISH